MESFHAVKKAAAHAVFTATCYCLGTHWHIKHQQKIPTHPSTTKNPTLSQPQQKLPGTSSDLKNAFSVGSIYKMQRSEQAKCSCRTDGPLPREFLPQEAGRTLCSLGKLMLKSMHIHGYFFEEIYPASTVEERKAGEAQGHSHNRVQSFSMNIRQAAATTENVC